MSEYRELFAEVADLQPPDRLRRRVTAPGAASRRTAAVGARIRRPVLLGLAVAATVIVVAALALVAHSRSASPAPANGLPLTRANVLAAARSHSLVRVQLFEHGPLPCAVAGRNLSGRDIFSVQGRLAVQSASGASGDTVANLAVVKDAALASRCAQQLFRADRNNPTNPRIRQLTPQILMTPIVPAHTAGNGAIVDGAYDIWGSVGRIVYSGGAGNRADAEALQRSLAAVAAEFAR